MPLTIPLGDRYVHALNDGVFRTPPNYFDRPGVFDQLADSEGHLATPIGAFLWTGSQNVLIDAGVGPIDYMGRGLLVGGSLLDELRASDVEPEEINILALSHLHPDHAGWLATPEGALTFENATVVVSRDDWTHFLVNHPEQIADHLSHALETLSSRGQVELVDGERDVAPGIRLIPAPGHTPGHSIFALHDHDERLLLLGDSVFCPLQLNEHDLGTLSDLDKSAATRTRTAISRELERHDTKGVGCHFPGLVAGRLLGAAWIADSNGQ